MAAFARPALKFNATGAGWRVEDGEVVAAETAAAVESGNGSNTSTHRMPHEAKNEVAAVVTEWPGEKRSATIDDSATSKRQEARQHTRLRACKHPLALPKSTAAATPARQLLLRPLLLWRPR